MQAKLTPKQKQKLLDAGWKYCEDRIWCWSHPNMKKKESDYSVCYAEEKRQIWTSGGVTVEERQIAFGGLEFGFGVYLTYGANKETRKTLLVSYGPNKETSKLKQWKFFAKNATPKDLENCVEIKLSDIRHREVTYCIVRTTDHGHQYFFIGSIGEFVFTCCDILEMYINDGMFSDNPEDLPNPPRFSKNEIESWEPGSLKEAAILEINNYEYDVRRQNTIKKQAAKIKQFKKYLKNTNYDLAGKIAFSFLAEMDDISFNKMYSCFGA